MTTTTHGVIFKYTYLDENGHEKLEEHTHPLPLELSPQSTNPSIIAQLHSTIAKINTEHSNSIAQKSQKNCIVHITQPGARTSFITKIIVHKTTNLEIHIWTVQVCSSECEEYTGKIMVETMQPDLRAAPGSGDYGDTVARMRS